jgi:hypothetical protein
MSRNAIARSIVMFTLIPASVMVTSTEAPAATQQQFSITNAVTIAAPSAVVAVATPAVYTAATPAVYVAAVPKVRAATAAQVMLKLTLTSTQTRDMRGVETSLYRGRYFKTGVETKRRCIAKRESEGHYDVVSHNGYYGAYQMSPALAVGATWMMLPEHKKILGDAVATRVLNNLRHTPLSHWTRYWQDAAFSTIFNWDGTGSGASHWSGGRWHC